MLKSFRVSNYRCIQDLKVEFDSINLLIGDNGSGKSTLFDALAAVRAFLVDHEPCDDVFSLESLPRWAVENEAKPHQTFSIEFQLESKTLTYELEIEFDPANGSSRVSSERLSVNSDPLFTFHAGMAHTYRDNLSPVNVYRAEDKRSVMAGVPAAHDFKTMGWVKNQISNFHCIRIESPQISARSEKDAAVPDRSMSNFASWYRRALLQDSASGINFLQSIREVMPGLSSLDLRNLGQGVMLLESVFHTPGRIRRIAHRPGSTYRLAFNELSDGQRSLICLYAILHFLIRDDATVWIDEPDNFVALPELQPWLNAVIDAVDANNSQVLIASHHPEMYNLLAPDHGIVLERSEAGPTTIRRYSADPESPLTPAERAARGLE